MTSQEKIQRGYMVSTRESGDVGLYRLSYVMRGVQQARTSGRAKKAPEHVAIVNVPDESVVWEKQPADPELAVEDFEADALRRATAIHDWLTMLTNLIGSVEEWAKEVGWSPKRIDKPMEDSEVGKYEAPALLLQEEMTKVFARCRLPVPQRVHRVSPTYTSCPATTTSLACTTTSTAGTCTTCPRNKRPSRASGRPSRSRSLKPVLNGCWRR